MNVMKAYILRTNNPKSIEYSETAAHSCRMVGLDYEYFEGYNAKELKSKNIDVWSDVKKHIPIKAKGLRTDGGSCATAGHFMIWKRIMDNKECAVIMEHDAVMLHYPSTDIPHNELVMLGYKCRDPYNYDHMAAGPPTHLEPRKKHGGAHAYAITHVTATNLLVELQNPNRYLSYIDNDYMFNSKGRGKHVGMSITSPTCAIGWLRDSTIWNRAATDNYGPILKSFTENYHSKLSLEIKK